MPSLDRASDDPPCASLPHLSTLLFTLLFLRSLHLSFSPGLLHLDNTVQMYKWIPTYTAKDFKRVKIWHKSHIQILYYRDKVVGAGGAGNKAGVVAGADDSAGL